MTPIISIAPVSQISQTVTARLALGIPAKRDNNTSALSMVV
jgi:hypothetical protein